MDLGVEAATISPGFSYERAPQQGIFIKGRDTKENIYRNFGMAHPEGYRKEQLSIEIKALKYLDLVKDEALPEGASENDVTVSDEEYADYLWQVYRDKDFPKPRNFIGMTKKLPASEMEKLIYANTEVNAEALGKLARARAQAVQNFLTEDGQLPKDRIFLKEPDITSAPDEETANRARVEALLEDLVPAGTT